MTENRLFGTWGSHLGSRWVVVVTQSPFVIDFLGVCLCPTGPDSLVSD